MPRNKRKPPSDARLRAASRRWDERGCARCGCAWSPVEATAQHPRTGRVEIFCVTCAPKTGWACIALGASVTDYAATDRAWFKAHPSAAHRIREPQPGEIESLEIARALENTASGAAITPAPSGDALILVVQRRPGERLRLQIGAEVAADPEALSHAIRRARALSEARAATPAHQWAMAHAQVAPAWALARTLGMTDAPSPIEAAKAQGEAHRTNATRH